MHLLSKNKQELFDLADILFKNPELGYKEFKTKEILENYFNIHNIEIINLGFETAFKVSIGKGEPHIGLIAELDAIPTLGHKYTNKKDNNAAHSCGHFSQCAIMAYTIRHLKEIIKKGTITLYFTPAEEYTDISYRQKLIKEGKINYIGGKINMLVAKMFDKEDLFIHLHTMSQGKYQYSLNSSLCGFLYKEITFKGKASHAAMAPEEGINALNAYVLFNNAINMLRETFKEEDYIRIHGIIKEGGQTVNSIPEKVIYECYVRANNNEALLKTAKKVDDAAKYASKAIGAKATIKTSPGYLPIYQNKIINEIIKNKMLDFVKEEDINDYEISMAAGDIGDLSIFKPTVQFGYGGFKGICHSKDLEINNYDKALLEPAIIIYETVLTLLNDKEYIKQIKSDFKPLMNMKDYLSYLNN